MAGLRGKRVLLGGTASHWYARTAPSPQNAVDLFPGEWTSELPDALGGVRAGSVPLFADDRIAWAIDALGGVNGSRILELGPLEGGHTAMLHAAGAGEVVAVEGHGRAYLRCLVVKELLGLTRARFLCGDFLAYLESGGERFDVCVASGVLYHMTDPVRLLAAMASRADRLVIWTHYFDAARIADNRRMRRRMRSPAVRHSAAGYAHALHRHEYRTSLRFASFCGGSNRYACWLTRDGLFGALAHLGFDETLVAFDEPHHPNGPAIAIIAQRW